MSSDWSMMASYYFKKCIQTCIHRSVILVTFSFLLIGQIFLAHDIILFLEMCTNLSIQVG